MSRSITFCLVFVFALLSVNAALAATQNPVITFMATKYKVKPGEKFRLNWNAKGAKDCFLSGDSSEILNEMVKQKSSRTLTQGVDTVYTLYCYNKEASAEKKITVEVTTPTLELMSSAEITSSGMPVGLRWKAKNLSGCVASGAWSGGKKLIGSETVRPKKGGKYTLTCSNSNTSLVRTVAVNVMAPNSSFSFTVDKSQINLGESIALAWSVQGYDSCRAAGPWIGERPVSGSVTSTPYVDSIYHLECFSKAGYYDHQQIYVSVIQPTNEDGGSSPNVEFSGNKSKVGKGEDLILTWSAKDAVIECQASGEWGGTKPLQGTETIKNVKTGSYYLRCGNEHGATEQYVNIYPKE